MSVTQALSPSLLTRDLGSSSTHHTGAQYILVKQAKHRRGPEGGVRMGQVIRGSHSDSCQVLTLDSPFVPIVSLDPPRHSRFSHLPHFTDADIVVQRG